VTDIHYYSERAKSELHLTDIKANTKMKVTARPMFKVTKIMKNKSPKTKQNDLKTYLHTPEYGYRSTSEHIALHTRIHNITEAEYNKQTENIPYSAPYKFRTKITADEHDIKMPCGTRKGVAKSTNRRNEAKENIRRTRALSKVAQDRMRMEMKRKQAMLKKEKTTKNEHKRRHGQSQYKTEKHTVVGRNDEWRPRSRSKICASRREYKQLRRSNKAHTTALRHRGASRRKLQDQEK
jgi:hypothetical protein